MNILFISKNLLAGNTAYRLVQEGHSVKMFIKEKDGKHCFDMMVPKVKNWKSELKWVGKDGLIVFDDTGYGKEQDALRKKGYRVFGGSYLGERLETDREYGHNIFQKYGIQTVPLKDFNNVFEAVDYATKNPNKWVLKQNNGQKVMNFVSNFDDGRDLISVLKNYSANKKINKEKVTLQERIDGVEIGIGRYFNGKNWVGPVEYNIEHTKFFPGNLGPITSEMGTIAWYDDNEENILYKSTIKKLETFLRDSDFRGDFEINCIVNEKGIFPLEASARLGSPIIHLHDEIHLSPWGDFLYAVANGDNFDLKWKKGYGIVVLMAVPPFPYAKKIAENLSFGINVYFDKLSDEEMKHVHFEEIALRPKDFCVMNYGDCHTNLDRCEHKTDKKQYYIADSQGYICYVTGMGATVEEARKMAYPIADKIVIPKAMYRNDIGVKFEAEELPLLKKWGYL